ncbi:hypothetical protein D9615_002378 [Tricholomella constricta]|uniref:Uncharacterized protein n=1 Tax=Tricholomella constricta TaxID=117010 RepID=A0A8H5HMR3_9AGAR|nr:hypothetical protein D9615_002378 [Tricholomella constricta]
MPPKVHRGGSTGIIRPHSRSSSSSKLGANLQFTQKEQLPPKPVDKPKKNGVGYDNIQPHGKGVARVASAQRVHSREHAQPFVHKQRPAPQTHKNNGARGKAGFTISSPGEDDDEDDWVSSESGAVTPSNDHSGSETESDDNTTDEDAIRRLAGERQTQSARPPNGTQSETPVLPRIETARPSDFRPAMTNSPQPQHQPQHQRLARCPEVHTPTLLPMKTEPTPHLQHPQAQNHRSFDNETIGEHATPEVPSPSHPSSRSSSKRQVSTRPPSSHSTRGDNALRPHPLIRGPSYGQVYPAKPPPLEPLTVIQDASTSASPPEYVFDGSQLSTSPSSSIRTDATSPGGSNRGQQRRTSVSSGISVATLPVHSGLRDSVSWSLSDRKRTLSTVSNSASSAALSSLVHLPTVTRPPSPQAIAFFPPVNPHANIGGIHPLLPGPYLNNHLTVLARRTPIKEAFDRVIRAKQVRT